MRRLLLAFLISCSPATSDPGTVPDTTATAEATASVAEPEATATVTTAPSATATASATPSVEPPIDLAQATLPAELKEGAGHVRDKAWSKAAKSIEAALPAIKKNGRVEEWLAANALLGRSRAALSDPWRAKAAFEAVDKGWSNDQAAFDSLGPEGPERLSRARVALEAVGEARFYFAEQKRIAMEKTIKMPVYHGSGEGPDVTKHMTGPVAKWITERRAAMAEVEKEYLKILEIRPFPPGQWVVRAAERVGGMHVGHHREVVTAPKPKDWLGDGDISGLSKADIREMYDAALADAMKPTGDKARAAYKVCTDKAKQYGVKIPEVETCTAWLEANR